MASYKEGNEIILNTGSGLHGIELSTLQEFVVTNVCKYYHALDPVLRDRPNVRPVYTNYDEEVDTGELSDSNDINPKTDSIHLSSDDDSIESYVSPPSPDVEVLYSNVELNSRKKDDNDEYETMSTMSNQSFTSNKPTVSTSNTVLDENSSDDIKSQTQISNNNRKISKRKTGSSSSKSNSITPMQAKKLQKSLKKKTIRSRRGKSMSMANTDADNEDREYLKESRNTKMDFEMRRHNDMTTIESEKLRIEKERLKMDQINMAAKQKQILVQTNLEQSRIGLIRLEMFQARQKIKKDYPEVTDDYLNENFPYPE